MLLLTVYQPPHFSANFKDEFVERMSVISPEFDKIILTGEFNLHVDNPNDNSAAEFYALLDSFDLFQHVNEPTHCQGHTLDLVIIKGVSLSITAVKAWAISDHFCVFFDFIFITE